MRFTVTTAPLFVRALPQFNRVTHNAVGLDVAPQKVGLLLFALQQATPKRVQITLLSALPPENWTILS